MLVPQRRQLRTWPDVLHLQARAEPEQLERGRGRRGPRSSPARTDDSHDDSVPELTAYSPHACEHSHVGKRQPSADVDVDVDDRCVHSYAASPETRGGLSVWGRSLTEVRWWIRLPAPRVNGCNH